MSLRLSAVHRSTSRARQQARARNRRRRLWAPEGLEGRVLLSATPYLVINTSSDPTVMGSLPWGVTQANANTNAAGSIIEFDPTVFATPQTITLSSTLVLSESPGPEVIDGPSAGVVISGNNAVEVFQVNGGVTATLADLTISGGSANYGGGIHNSGTLTVSGSTVAGSSAVYFGGGIYNGGTLTVTGSAIESNMVTDSCCGAAGGGIANFGTLTVSDSTLTDNSVAAFDYGGGISNYGTLTVSGSNVTGNSTGDYGSGGGISSGGGTVTLTSSSISENSTGYLGSGGGIWNSGTLAAVNSTIADNASGNEGGGIYNARTLTAVNSTIAYNAYIEGGAGGGVYDSSGAATTLDNTIVAANTGYDGVLDDINGAPASVSGQSDLVGFDDTGSLTNGTNGNLVIGATNPGLGLLAYNGGPTQTIALFAGSPAINAGNNALANEYSLTTDQRGAGFPRIVDGGVDIGAYERAAPASTGLVSSPNPSVYGQTITLTATVTAGSPATVYTVNSTGSGSSGTGTSGTLPYVISQADLNPNLAGSVILFAPTVFSASDPQTITLTSTLELAGPSGPLVIDGPGAGAVTISGGGAVEVFLAEPGAVTTLSGLTISGGSAANGGGGIFVEYDSTLTITNSTIAGNSTAGDGGGISNGGTMTVSGCTIENNTATDTFGGGGGILNFGYATLTVTGGSTIEGNTANAGGGIYNYATLTVTDSTIDGNTASVVGAAYGGGGILIDNSTATITGCTFEDNTTGAFGGGVAGGGTITDCTFEGNTADVGGGVYAIGTTTITGSTFAGNMAYGAGAISNNGTLTVADSTIAGNSANLNGGGISNDGVATVIDCTVDDNTAGTSYGDGGGISNGGTLSIIDSTIAGNSADYYSGGGGIVNYDTLTVSGTTITGNTANDGTTGGGGGVLNYGTFTVTDSTITDNSAAGPYGYGGGIYNAGMLTIVNSTIAYNISYADYGGGMYDSSGATTTLDNTIVDINTPDDINGAAVSSASAYNLVGIDNTGSLTNGNDGNLVGVTNPGLATGLANNGGPTQTIALLAGSPAIEAGSTALAVDPSTSLPLTTDQRGGGYPRIVNGTVDIGAFEVQAAPVTTTATTVGSQANPSAFGQSVAFTATVVPSIGSGTPAGAVQFLIDGSDFGSPVPLVNGSAVSASISSLSVATHTIEAVYSGGTGFAASTGTLTQTVNPANTSSSPPSVPPTGSVSYYVGAVNPADEIGTGTLSTNSNGVTTATFSTHSLPAGTFAITAVYGGDTNYPESTSNVVSQTVTPAPLVITANNQAKSYGQANPALTVSYSGFVNGDTPASLTTLPTVTTTATTSSPVGSYPITASGALDPNYTISYVAGTLTISQSIIVLDPTAGGALSLSGNATIKLTGGVFVDSSSSSAISASGNATVKASVIDVHGGVQKSGNASFSPAPITGAATLPDPLASLAEPSASGLIGSETLSGNSSATIKPGIYSQISVSGNGTLTMNSGLYIIEGGGFTVSGNGNVTGSGVTIFNAGSKYPTTGGTYGSIALSGNGSYNLSPPTTGTYAGIVIFQSRDNTKALSLSGNASGMTGTIYAPAAQLAESGNAQLNAAVVVDTMTISGNGISNTVTLSSPSGTVAYTPAQIRAAYGISALALDGTGQTIAIVDAYDDPSIGQALDAFDSQFGLTASGPTLYAQYGPASSFLTVLNQNGQATSLPSTDPNGPGTNNWEVEEALDVEWAHAIAPGAQIILVEANSESLSDLMAAVGTAAHQPGVSVVSMSWGFPEGQAVFAADEADYDSI
ncbi:MAG: beta strand repeat-containing protein, partial [Isosphaeraceae bacterium]